MQNLDQSLELSHNLVIHDPNKHFVANPHAALIYRGNRRCMTANKICKLLKKTSPSTIDLEGFIIKSDKEKSLVFGEIKAPPG